MYKSYETERLVLKVLDDSLESANLVLNYFNRNRAHLKPFDPLKSEAFYKVENRRAALEEELIDLESGKQLRLWIFEKTDTLFENIVGTIGFTRIVRGFSSSCYMGYSIDHAHKNKGYMTEAVQKGLEVMFKEYELHRIEATVMPKNLPSLKVLEKLNFENEGLSKKYQKINGQWEDHFRLALLNPSIE